MEIGTLSHYRDVDFTGVMLPGPTLSVLAEPSAFLVSNGASFLEPDFWLISVRE